MRVVGVVASIFTVVSVLVLVGCGARPAGNTVAIDAVDPDESMRMLSSAPVDPQSRNDIEHSIVGIEIVNRDGVRLAYCSGALAEQQDVVLTAAHCFDRNVNGMEYEKVYVHFSDDLETSMQNRMLVDEPLRIVLHDHYDSQGKDVETSVLRNGVASKEKVRRIAVDNDIALLFLSRPAPAPFKFGSINTDAAAGLTKGRELVSYGFGRANDYNERYLVDAAKLTMHLQRGEFLVAAPSTFGRMATDQKSKSSACNGDSGGPLFAVQGKKVVPGIVGVWSATMGRAITPTFRLCRGPSLYTPIHGYRDWIHEQIDKYGGRR